MTDEVSRTSILTPAEVLALIIHYLMKERIKRLGHPLSEKKEDQMIRFYSVLGEREPPLVKSVLEDLMKPKPGVDPEAHLQLMTNRAEAATQIALDISNRLSGSRLSSGHSMP